jgi:hypothetical protein
LTNTIAPNSVNARIAAVKQRITAVLDEYEAELAFDMAVARAYFERTGKDLGPNDPIPPEDEITAHAMLRRASGVMQ